ncbi:23S rRNA (guanosine(2251)-2'-O)-methyltransferase RlmB [Magnetococcales bacterium HHB-1]
MSRSRKAFEKRGDQSRRSTKGVKDSGEGSDWIVGINAVLALLQDPERPVDEVCVLHGSRNRRVGEIIDHARARGVRPKFLDRNWFDRLNLGVIHQGVAVRAALRVQPRFEPLLEKLSKQETPPLLLILDGVLDPGNLGAIMRSAWMFGAHAVITTKDRAAPLTPVAAKASVGAAEKLDLVRVTNLARALRTLQEENFFIFGLAGEAEKSLSQANFSGASALIMGSEEKGLRRLTREHCDELLAIPMIEKGGSLNVSVAAGVALYEVQRQRGQNV